MTVTIKGYKALRLGRIQHACRDEWEFDDFIVVEYGVEATGRSQLCGGETEEEFVDRLTGAIWMANGAFCTVEVTAIYLEEQPTTQHALDEIDYEEWKGKQ
jgi:hypothetical protein